MGTRTGDRHAHVSAVLPSSDDHTRSSPVRSRGTDVFTSHSLDVEIWYATVHTILLFSGEQKHLGNMLTIDADEHKTSQPCPEPQGSQGETMADTSHKGLLRRTVTAVGTVLERYIDPSPSL